METLYETTLTILGDTDKNRHVMILSPRILYMSAVDASEKYTYLYSIITSSDFASSDITDYWESFSEDTYAFVEITDDIDASYYKWVVNVYFQQDPNTYDVILNPNSDEFSEDEYIIMEDLEYYTSYTLPANTYTKDGRTFKEWNTEADGSGTSYADEATVSNLTTEDGATVTLYAQWEYIVAIERTLHRQSTSDITSAFTSSAARLHEYSGLSYSSSDRIHGLCFRNLDRFHKN